MELIKKLSAGRRLSLSDARELESLSIFEAAELARFQLSRLDPSGEVGYIVNRMINYSNVCRAQCGFCAYHARAGRVDSFRLSDGEILEICSDAVGRGAVQIMLQGGLHEDFTLAWAESLLKKIKSAFPKLCLHVFSPSEIVWFARAAGVSIEAAVAGLKSAGADSVPGAADMLVPRIRKSVCGNKCSVEEWVSVMRALAKFGMRSSATMTFGLGETFTERLEHFDIVRSLQDEIGVFDAFIAWPVAPENTMLEGRLQRVGAPEFLKTIAIARAWLDNIKYIQSGWLTEGLKIAEIALGFGANDVGGVLMDEMVVRAAGIDNKATAQNMRRTILNAGFCPRERDGFYKTLRTF